MGAPRGHDAGTGISRTNSAARATDRLAAAEARGPRSLATCLADCFLQPRPQQLLPVYVDDVRALRPLREHLRRTGAQLAAVPVALLPDGRCVCAEAFPPPALPTADGRRRLGGLAGFRRHRRLLRRCGRFPPLLRLLPRPGNAPTCTDRWLSVH